MRISELARRADLPVATVKFYLREHLLPPGRLTAATQAEYDESHLARLHLVRALVGAGGLSLSRAREVLKVIDDQPRDVGAAVSTVHEALAPTDGVDDAHRQRAQDLVRRQGWVAAPESASVRQLAAALQAVEAAGLISDDEHLQTYARAALAVASQDVASVPRVGPDEMAAYVVLGTVLYEPVLLALRRVAQQHAFVTGATAAATHGPGDDESP